MKKLVITLLSSLFLFSACMVGKQCVDRNPVPFYNKEMTISNKGTGKAFWYYTTKDYIRGVDTLKEDIGMIISRENGEWNYSDMWLLNTRIGKNEFKVLKNIFDNNVKLDIEEVLPPEKFENVTVSIWLVSKRVIIMLGPGNNDSKELYSSLLESLNKEIMCGR